MLDKINQKMDENISKTPSVGEINIKSVQKDKVS